MLLKWLLGNLPHPHFLALLISDISVGAPERLWMEL